MFWIALACLLALPLTFALLSEKKVSERKLLRSLQGVFLSYSILALGVFVAIDFFGNLSLAPQLIVVITTPILIFKCSLIGKNHLVAKTNSSKKYPKKGDKSPGLATSKIIIASLFILSIFMVVGTDNLLDLKYRNGPDGFGWANSSLYFKQANSTEELTDYVSNQLDPLDIEEALEAGAYGPGQSPIYAISDFASQVQSEFILSSKRVTIPGIQGLILREFKSLEINIWSLQSLILFAFLFLTILLVFWHLSFYIMRVSSIIIATFFIVTLPIFSVLLEGGVGNAWITPILLFNILLFNRLLKRDESVRPLDVVFAYSMAWILVITINLDYVPILLLMYPIYIWTIARGFGKSPGWTPLRIMFYALIPLLALAIDFGRVLAALINRSNDRQVGGWNVGHWPGGLEFLNLIDWIGATGVASKNFTYPLLYALGIILFVGICLVLLRGIRNDLLAAVPLYFLATYTVLNVFLLMENSSSYQIWKLNSFLSPSFLMTFIPILASKGKLDLRFERGDTEKRTVISVPIWVPVIVGLISSSLFLSNVATNARAIDREFFDIARDTSFVDSIQEQEIVLIGSWSTAFGVLLFSDTVHYRPRTDVSYDFTYEKPRERIYLLKSSVCFEAVDCDAFLREEVVARNSSVIALNQSGYLRLSKM